MIEDIASVGSPVEKLKDAFGPQQVPLASNFSDLIDLADIGRKVAGLSPDQPRGQGRGLQLDENLKLAVLPKVAGGISVSDMGVGITVETDKGITVGPNGLAIKPGSGLYLGAAGVGVTAAADMGLAVDARGLAVKPGNGIHLDPAGVNVTVAPSMGLTVDVNGVAVKPGNGIHLDPAGVNVTVAPSMGLTVDDNGVAVKPGNGVKLGVTGVEVMTKVGGALLVDGDGVGINCGAGLALSQNQLILSPAMPSRITSTYSVDGEFYWRTLCSCPASCVDCYAELVVTAQGDGFKQRFNLLISLDGNPINNNNRSFVVSVLNAGNKPSDQWAIDKVRLGVGYDGEAYVQAGFTSGSPVTVSVSYSPLDVNGINMHGFEVSNIQFVQGTLSSRTSGTMQG